jgi:hypothetical protein
MVVVVLDKIKTHRVDVLYKPGTFAHGLYLNPLVNHRITRIAGAAYIQSYLGSVFHYGKAPGEKWFCRAVLVDDQFKVSGNLWLNSVVRKRQRIVGIFLKSIERILKLIDESVQAAVGIFGEKQSVVLPVAVQVFYGVPENSAGVGQVIKPQNQPFIKTDYRCFIISLGIEKLYTPDLLAGNERIQ